MGACASLCFKSIFSLSGKPNIKPIEASSTISVSSTETTTTTTTTKTDKSFSQGYGSTTGSSTASTSNGHSTCSNGPNVVSFNIKMFTLRELKKATNYFNKNMVLGEGGFGMVYKGWVDPMTMKPAKKDQGMLVAVKKLRSGGNQGIEEWQAEITFLGKYSHPNLVKLYGCCVDKKELLLVYEFMPNGSLEDHLFKREADQQTLPWTLRLKIATNAARGLAFLHSSAQKVIYRDFKASNILLDSNYNAKISDFGLAKAGPPAGKTHVSTRVMGTMGYAAPEYISTGHLQIKSDVYSFGVVLLELLSGQRAWDSTRESRKRSMVESAKILLNRNKNKKNLVDFMDKKLDGNYSIIAATATANLALKCVEISPQKRPGMTEVLANLEKIVSVNLQGQCGKKQL